MLRLLALLAFALIAACYSSPSSSRTWIVASDLDNKPFAWVDERGEPRGRDVEMMRMLADELGASIDWKRMPFDALLPACERGEVDVVCATLGITEERAQRVRFTRAYFETHIVLVVRSGAKEPRTHADLDGKKVAGSPGTTSEAAVRALLPRSIGVFEGSKDAGPTLERLLARSIDAAAMDGPAARTLVATSGGRLTILAAPLTIENYALALPRSHEELAVDLTDAIERLKPRLRELDVRHGLVD